MAARAFGCEGRTRALWPIRLGQLFLLAAATVTGNPARADQPAASTLFPMLTGTWTKPEVWRGALWWSKADGDGWARKIHAKGGNSKVRLDLSFAEARGKIAGTLDAIGPENKKMNVVTFVIASTEIGCTLVWNEAGFRYRLTLEGNCPPAPRTQDAKTLWLLRFVKMQGPRRRTPYPIIIEFRLSDGKLTLRRVQGPQHGAAVDQTYDFAPAQDPEAAPPAPSPSAKPSTEREM